MKSLYKYELADMAGVSLRTLQRWMARNREQLILHGCHPHDHLVRPRAIRFIAEEYGIDVE